MQPKTGPRDPELNAQAFDESESRPNLTKRDCAKTKMPRERTREHTDLYVTEVGERSNAAIARRIESDCLRLYGQANKRTRWMPRQQEAMKDVVACEKLRGAGKLALIRRCPNGETHRFGGIHA